MLTSESKQTWIYIPLEGNSVHKALHSITLNTLLTKLKLLASRFQHRSVWYTIFSTTQLLLGVSPFQWGTKHTHAKPLVIITRLKKTWNMGENHLHCEQESPRQPRAKIESLLSGYLLYKHSGGLAFAITTSKAVCAVRSILLTLDIYILPVW